MLTGVRFSRRSYLYPALRFRWGVRRLNSFRLAESDSTSALVDATGTTSVPKGEVSLIKASFCVVRARETLPTKRVDGDNWYPPDTDSLWKRLLGGAAIVAWVPGAPNRFHVTDGTLLVNTEPS